MTSPSTVRGDAAGAPAPLSVLTAGSGGAVGWVADHREQIRARVDDDGAVLVRGLGLASPADLAAVADALGVQRIAERERFAPRRAHAEGVYSASEWPPEEPMCMHHELSYAKEVPSLLLFGCLAAGTEGGRIEVADSQTMLRILPPDLVERFSREGWTLTRMYHEVGVSWAESFGTSNPSDVVAYCMAADVGYEWLPERRLFTRQRRAAVLRHPRTGVPGFFNQIAFLNERTLDPEIRQYLVDVYGPTGLPFNTAYGSGQALSAETVETINEAYRSITVGGAWGDGDLLVVDNLRMAHSRTPYSGPRTVAVVLGDPVRLPAFAVH